MDRMKEIGFNYIRLPFSMDFIKKDDWTEMDQFFEKAEQNNISISLDFHRLHNSFQ
jgi:aryl-phospho-beta-D-glucosidase BglC (GH1 family)